MLQVEEVEEVLEEVLVLLCPVSVGVRPPGWAGEGWGSEEAELQGKFSGWSWPCPAPAPGWRWRPAPGQPAGREGRLPAAGRGQPGLLAAGRGRYWGGRAGDRPRQSCPGPGGRERRTGGPSHPEPGPGSGLQVRGIIVQSDQAWERNV